MRRGHRRLHFLIWIVVSAGIIGGVIVILNLPHVDVTEPYQPPSE